MVLCMVGWISVYLAVPRGSRHLHGLRGGVVFCLSLFCICLCVFSFPRATCPVRDVFSEWHLVSVLCEYPAALAPASIKSIIFSTTRIVVITLPSSYVVISSGRMLLLLNMLNRRAHRDSAIIRLSKYS